MADWRQFVCLVAAFDWADRLPAPTGEPPPGRGGTGLAVGHNLILTSARLVNAPQSFTTPAPFVRWPAIGTEWSAMHKVVWHDLELGVALIEGSRPSGLEGGARLTPRDLRPPMIVHGVGFANASRQGLPERSLFNGRPAAPWPAGGAPSGAIQLDPIIQHTTQDWLDLVPGAPVVLDYEIVAVVTEVVRMAGHAPALRAVPVAALFRARGFAKQLPPEVNAVGVDGGPGLRMPAAWPGGDPGVQRVWALAGVRADSEGRLLGASDVLLAATAVVIEQRPPEDESPGILPAWLDLVGSGHQADAARLGAMAAFGEATPGMRGGLALAFEEAKEIVGNLRELSIEDLITVALLANGDPTLDDFAAAAGRSVRGLQDAWFDFVTHGKQRDRETWERWWRRADVPLPSVGGWADVIEGGPDRSVGRVRTAPGAARRIIDTGWHPLADGMPPAWASGWGQDRFGVYVDFTVDGVTQRLRWIPPGPFLMGSSELEVSRFADEGPQHEVTIEAGFWLFATPVTQALYKAVTGDDPSRFQGAERPVEHVSWHDAQAFMARLNERVPGLDLVLPSEAQWEHACRTGTETVTYAGDLPETGGGEALDSIAWYAGNSGGETHPVALKKPNAWGLYDMLGNVWEWCADHWHDSYTGAPADGQARLDADTSDDADRVVRGGSWVDEARRCRAACRDRYRADDRDSDLGFRPARGQG